MEREKVLVPEAELRRQREFGARVRAMFAAREAHPIACVDTFGCQQNVADGQKLMGMLERMGFTFTGEPREADLVILNTCAVREHAEDRVFGNVGALKNLKRRKPGLIIGVCGCMTEQPEVAKRLQKTFPFVNLVFGTHVLHRLPEMLYEVLSESQRVLLLGHEGRTPSCWAVGVPGSGRSLCPMLWEA